ncbi:hypothetical protein, partial [Thermodesulfitimonas autotrophica]
MIIVMANNATEQEIEGVIRRIEDEGFK